MLDVEEIKPERADMSQQGTVDGPARQEAQRKTLDWIYGLLVRT